MLFFRANESFDREMLLTAEEIEHLRSLRLNEEDKTIEVRDGKGNSYFFHVGAKQKIGRLVNTDKHILTEPSIQIAAAIPKSGKFEILIQKGTEIGVSQFIFVNFQHSERREINIERTNKLIIEACIQSKRHSIPTIQFYSSLKDFLKNYKNIILLNPYSDHPIKTNSDWSAVPLIGPEGGFREEELDEILKHSNNSGFTLGDNILRIETAFISIAAIYKFKLS